MGINRMVAFARSRRALGLLVLLAGIVAAARSSRAASEQQLFVESRQAMGTTFKIYLYADNEPEAWSYFEAAFDEIERLEEALSNYRPSSELSRINRLAARQPVTTDPEVFDLLVLSVEYSRRSNGAFDITVGPLMRAWGFFRGQGHYPAADELARARAKIGWQHLDLDRKTRTVRFLVPGMELDLGSIGKGYAVDRVVAVLRELGVKSALVDAGSSSIFAIGTPPGKSGWTVRVPKPGDKSEALSIVSLHDTSLSTSGNYEKFFRLNGREYTHIMDPHTGEPVQGMLQTTVIAPSATDSDALSTALFVMGPQAGSRLLQSVADSSAFWVSGDSKNSHISGWLWTGRRCSKRGECESETSAALETRTIVERNSKPR